MINLFFLHNFIPAPIAFNLFGLSFRWYGIILSLAILVALLITIKLAKLYKLSVETILDLTIYLIIGGLIGARLYDVFLNLDFYKHDWLEIIKVWHGGLAIHGGLIGGLVVLLIFSYYKKINFYLLASIILPGLALGQAIGRWGNWFNQELFGLPTKSFIGIPIDLASRPLGYENYNYFQPTFLYESLSLLLIGLILYWLVKKQKLSNKKIIASYLIGYGIIRFVLEFIKIDPTPVIGFLRWPQVISLAMILAGIYFLFLNKKTTTLK